MGLFRSSDQGQTWEDMEIGRFSPITYGRDVKVSPSEPNTLYSALSVAASSHDGGLYRSEDGGQSWTALRQGPGARHDHVDRPASTATPNQVYIGARYDGEVFGTSDAGKTWQAMPLPGEVQHIYSVACG